MKMFCFFVLLGFLLSVAVFSDSEFTSKIDDEGNFLNRIKFDQDESAISLTSEVSCDSLMVEPTYNSNNILLGRLNLKGFIREAYSSSSNSASASVYTENGSMTVTDSFSRTSRFGCVLIPEAMTQAALWAFRANNNQLSSGILLQNMEINILKSLRIEGDLGLIIGSSLDNASDSLFGEKPLIKVQPVFHPVIEIRLGLNSEKAEGRKIISPNYSDFNVSLSLFGAYSLPLYTDTDGLVRVLVSMGTRQLNIIGNIVLAGQNYISADGKLLNTLFNAGLVIDSNISIGEVETRIEGEYKHEIKRASVIPSRYIQQSDYGMLAVKLLSDSLETRISIKFRRDYDCNGLNHDIGCGDAAIKLILEPIWITFEYNCEITGEDIYFDNIDHGAGAEIGFNNDQMKLCINSVFSDLPEPDLGVTFNLKQNDNSFNFTVNLEALKKISFSTGFTTKW